MAGLIGKKLGMTQIFTKDGMVVPVTVLEVGPCSITQIKTLKNDKYESIQLGFGKRKAKNTPKPLQGHFKKAKVEYPMRVQEFKFDNIEQYQLGQELKVSDVFSEGDKVKVTGISKGRGFAGTIKRHGFGGGSCSHGRKFHNAHGSTGMNTSPARTLKNKRMAGHYGNKKVSVTNLEVVKIYPEKNLMLVKGAVPGHKNGFVSIYK